MNRIAFFLFAFVGLAATAQAQDGTETLIRPLQRSTGAIYIQSSPYCALKIGDELHAFNHSDVSAVKNDWIKSVEVYKDAQAVELYGKKARKGAVIITIKEGEENKALEFLKSRKH